MLTLINNFTYWGKTMYNNMSNNKNNNNNMQQTNLNIINNKHNKSIMHMLPIWLRESKPAGIARGLLGSVETDFLIEWKRKPFFNTATKKCSNEYPTYSAVNFCLHIYLT